MAKQLLAKEVTAAYNAGILARAQALKEKGITPKLVIVRCGEEASQIAYERSAMKRAEALCVEAEKIFLPETVLKEELIAELKKLNADAKAHGVILLRPLPEHLIECQTEIFNVLNPAKDVDSMTDMSNSGVYVGKELGFPPCTPQACMEILDYYGVGLKGKDITVIGRSLVVGRPVALMLINRDATVTVCHTKTKNIKKIAKRADIIITSAGVLNSLTKDHVRQGQIVIDVSVNWDPKKNDGKGGMSGDAVFSEVEPVVEAITPVPGGVGSVTTSVLIDHVVTAAERTLAKMAAL